MNKLSKPFSLCKYGLFVRFVEEDDADFIVKLRTDETLSRFLNPTTSDVDSQKNWINQYKIREAANEDYYFLFEAPKGTPIGVCRIYGIKADSFEIGSWLFSPQAPMGAAILADIITRELAFDLFPNSTLHFDVRKGNTNVLRYQHTYKPVIIEENDHSFYFELTKDNFNKYKKMQIRMFAPKKMTNLEKYNNAFTENFQISLDQLNGLTYQSVQLWDSVGHMALISTLEDVFDVMFETDDIIALSSYEKGLEILKNTYDVAF